MAKEKTINDLVVLSVFNIESRREQASFETLVKECFEKFPKIFVLNKHKQWPDARKLDNSLGRLRKKKLIKGSSQTFFALTQQGKKEAEEIKKALRQKKLL